MTYMLCDLAACGADLRFYDAQFRILRQSNPAEFPWGSTHWELWICAQNFNNACFSKALMPACQNLSNAGPLVPKGYCGDHISFFATNLISTQQNPEIVSAKISKELAAGRLAGPFDTPPFPNFRVSPLGVVPKKAPGEYHLIHHLSFPRGACVNDGISTEDASVQYARVDDTVAMIKHLRQGVFLAKTDIKSAFRIIPILPTDYDLLGIFWHGKYYYDRVMPMGCASSCRTFEIFSTAIKWVAKKHLSMPHLIHILDDYLMTAPTFHQCRINLDRFLSLSAYLGVPRGVLARVETTRTRCGPLS